MGRLAELERRARRAPIAVRAQVDVLADQMERLLQEATDDEAWSDQLGPAYTTKQVASLLGITKQAVAKRAGLLRVVQRDGRTVYPVVQFDGSGVVPGVQQVVLELTPHVADPLTIAAWLTSPQEALDQRTPLRALRRGEVSLVTDLARRFAAALRS